MKVLRSIYLTFRTQYQFEYLSLFQHTKEQRNKDLQILLIREFP